MPPNSIAGVLFGVVAVTGIAAAAALAGPRATPGRTIVYVSNAESREISVLALNEDGTTSEVQRVAVSGKVMPLAISPGREWLYASLRSEPFSVSSFAIDPQRGTLTPAGTAPLPDDMAYLTTDRSGRYLLGASFFGNKLSVNATRPNGAINPQPIQVIATGQNAHAVMVDPSNRFLFVPNLGDDQIQQFRFDAASGTVTPNAPAAVPTSRGAGPRHLALHPDGRWVFCVDETGGTVTTYRLDQAGTLTPIDSTSLMPPGFEGKSWAADIHLTPDGKFLYASERTSSTIAAFAVDGDRGQLRRIGNYPTEQQPRGFQIDPLGRFLLAAGERSNRVRVCAIDRRTGALRELSRQAVGSGPNWIEIVTLPGRSRR